MEKQRIVFIVNPVSGIHHQRKTKLIELIPRVLPSADYEYQVHFTRGKGDGTAIAQKAIREGATKIVAVGGDGTINEVAQALVNTQLPMGIVPYGSGNGLANHLHLPRNPEEILNVIGNGRTLDIDTIWLNEHLVVSIAGMGFDARVAREYAKEARRGFIAYAKIAIKEYLTFRQREFRITSSTIDFGQKAMLLSIANSDQFGYNTSIAPEASVNDGFADITVVRKVPYSTLILTAFLLFTKKIKKSRYVSTFRLEECFIERSKGKYVNIDGEPVRMPLKVHMKILPRSLRIVVP